MPGPGEAGFIQAQIEKRRDVKKKQKAAAGKGKAARQSEEKENFKVNRHVIGKWTDASRDFFRSVFEKDEKALITSRLLSNHLRDGGSLSVFLEDDTFKGEVEITKDGFSLGLLHSITVRLPQGFGIRFYTLRDKPGVRVG